MCVLAHVFEAEGLSTVVVSLVRAHTEKINPPRALHCEFPLGRPLGKPGDAAFQRRVLDAAFGLLDAAEGPVLKDFPEEIADAESEALSCKIPPRANDGAPAAIDEARGLRPAFDRALAANGRTNVGRLTDADGIPDLIEGFIKIKDGAKWSEAGIPTNNLMEASKDVMSYYEEAASALSDHIPKARAAENWFFKETETGKLLLAAGDALHEAKNPIWFYLTPFTQRM